MLNDATGLKKIYLAAGYTDLRRGIDGLATMIRFLHFTELSGRHSVLERPLSEVNGRLFFS